MAKWLPNIREEGTGEKNDNNSEPQYYTKNKDGQWELYPPLSMYQRALRFLQDLRKK